MEVCGEGVKIDGRVGMGGEERWGRGVLLCPV